MNNGEIWLIDLNPTIGAEIQKIRPTIIVSSNAIGILPLKIIVPITDWKAHYAKVPWIVKLTPDMENKLTKISGADTFQVRSVSQQRFVSGPSGTSAPAIKTKLIDILPAQVLP